MHMCACMQYANVWPGTSCTNQIKHRNAWLRRHLLELERIVIIWHLWFILMNIFLVFSVICCCASMQYMKTCIHRSKGQEDRFMCMLYILGKGQPYRINEPLWRKGYRLLWPQCAPTKFQWWRNEQNNKIKWRWLQAQCTLWWAGSLPYGLLHAHNAPLRDVWIRMWCHKYRGSLENDGSDNNRSLGYWQQSTDHTHLFVFVSLNMLHSDERQFRFSAIIYCTNR